MYLLPFMQWYLLCYLKCQGSFTQHISYIFCRPSYGLSYTFIFPLLSQLFTFGCAFPLLLIFYLPTRLKIQPSFGIFKELISINIYTEDLSIQYASYVAVCTLITCSLHFCIMANSSHPIRWLAWYLWMMVSGLPIKYLKNGTINIAL